MFFKVKSSCESECGANEVCIGDGVCICQNGFSRDENGDCQGESTCSHLFDCFASVKVCVS